VSIGKINVLMVMLLLLAFVGQTMASTVMPYQMTTQSQSNHQMMSGMDHSAHTMDHDANMVDTLQTSMDCCDQDCSCVMGSCTSVTLTAAPFAIEAKITTQKIVQYLHHLLAQSPTSLYRPPILV
jgi:hypothetical protein